MAAIRLFIMTVAFMLAGCATLQSNDKLTLVKPHISSEQQATAIPFARSTTTRNSLAVVQKYYAAVAERDIDTALSFLALDVVRAEISAPACAWQIVKGLPAFERALENSNVLSFTVENFQVSGNTVTYTLTEWLDPRVVGPNFKQPARSHITAVVQNGEITDFILRRDSLLQAKEGELASRVCNTF